MKEETVRKRFRVEKIRGRDHAYALRDGETTLVTLGLENRRGSAATARSKNAQWVFKTAKLFRREIHVHGKDEKKPVAGFSLGWRGNGELTLDGTTYRFGPSNRRWTEWSWKDSRGNELLRYRLKFGIFKIEADVHASPALKGAVLECLSMLGWYVLILNHQDFESLAAAGIEKYLGKLARTVFRKRARA